MIMPNQAPAAETITGVVEAVNPKGVKIAGRWYNYSRYNEVPRPEKGQAVSLTADATPKGLYIRELTITGEATPTPKAAPGGSRRIDPAREQTITRLAVLKAAAEFAATRPGASSADVLTVAEAWEAWVQR